MSDAGTTKQDSQGSKASTPASTGRESPRQVKEESPKSKVTPSETHLEVPSNVYGRISGTFSDVSSISAGNESDQLQSPGLISIDRPGNGLSSRPSLTPHTWRASIARSWSKNKGLFLVILSQFFGVLMNVTTRLLETDNSHGPGMDPFQILFARMSGTLLLSCLYQWLAKVENAPFGPREVWPLLVARGVGGFFGVFGLYYSLVYLPLADATVITFLAPIVACWACSVLIHEPFTRSEQVAGIVSFLGVILIARPTSFLSRGSHSTTSGSGSPDSLPTTNGTTTASADSSGTQAVTPAQRLTAVGVAMIGVFGAACAYTTIRWIGKRAHPLISVNYYAAFTTLVSTVAVLAVPGVDFRLPANARQWFYLVFLGITGFVMQFLLTAGLAHERSSRATNMVYTQMLFALAFDKLVFDTRPGVLSIIGSALILGSALYVAVLNNKAKDSRKTTGPNGGSGALEGGREEEAVGLLIDDHDYEDEEYDVQEVQLRVIRV